MVSLFCAFFLSNIEGDQVKQLLPVVYISGGAGCAQTSMTFSATHRAIEGTVRDQQCYQPCAVLVPTEF